MSISNKTTQTSAAFVKSTAKAGQLHKAGTGLVKLHDHYINSELAVTVNDATTTIEDKDYSFNIPTLNLIDFSIMAILKDRVITSKGDSWNLICSNLQDGYLDALQAKYQRDLVNDGETEDELIVGVNLTSAQYQDNVIKLHKFNKVILMDLLLSLNSLELTDDIAANKKLVKGLQKVSKSLTSDIWNEKSLETFNYLVEKENMEKARIAKYKVTIDMLTSLGFTSIEVNDKEQCIGLIPFQDWINNLKSIKEYCNVVGQDFADDTTMKATMELKPV